MVCSGWPGAGAHAQLSSSTASNSASSLRCELGGLSLAIQHAEVCQCTICFGGCSADLPCPDLLVNAPPSPRPHTHNSSDSQELTPFHKNGTQLSSLLFSCLTLAPFRRVTSQPKLESTWVGDHMSTWDLDASASELHLKRRCSFKLHPHGWTHVPPLITPQDLVCLPAPAHAGLCCLLQMGTPHGLWSRSQGWLARRRSSSVASDTVTSPNCWPKLLL